MEPSGPEGIGSKVEFEEIEALGRKAATGDQAALDRLLAGVQPLLLSRCRRFLPNELDAEEAMQDALLAIARRVESFEGRAKFTTWMYQLTTNAAIDCYRKLKRRRSILEAPPDLAAAGSSPSVIAGARIDLLEATEQVDRRLVEPVLMRDLCELEYADIAELLAVPLGTVKSRIHDGRAQMRRALYGDGSAPAKTSHRRGD
jgi:RNA polymerase sigma factor (sigma-70 family)